MKEKKNGWAEKSIHRAQKKIKKRLTLIQVYANTSRQFLSKWLQG